LKLDRGPGDDGNALWGDEPYYGEGAVATELDGEHEHPLTIQPSGGNEARPRSIALLACIKY
jgi:hypothetical protein